MSKKMQTETIDRLFLELSQVTTATTAKEIELLDHIEAGWSIIANVNGGDWLRHQNKEWVKAAVKWRDEYHLLLKDKRPPESFNPVCGDDNQPPHH